MSEVDQVLEQLTHTLKAHPDNIALYEPFFRLLAARSQPTMEERVKALEEVIKFLPVPGTVQRVKGL